MELREGEIHEEAALRIAKVIRGSGGGTERVCRGKGSLKAETSGLLRINACLLKEINFLGEVVVAALHPDTICHAGMEVT